MYYNYLKYVFRHKWFVFLACCRLGIPFLGLFHDISKLFPSEFFAYAHYFYGEKFPNEQWFGDVRDHIRWEHTKAGIDHAFNVAWLHHQKRNKHHWQYWLLQEDNGNSWHLENPGDGYEPTWIVGENDEIKLTVLQSDQAANRLSHPDKKMRSTSDWGFQGFMPEQTHKVATYVATLLNANYKPIDMPLKYRKEMVADWRGAGMAITGKDNIKDWYRKNYEKIILHPNTRLWVDDQIFRK